MMKKILLVVCCIFLVGISIGCTQQDAEDIWTQNIYPATNNTYDIGSTTLQYQDGYFQNLHIANGSSLGNVSITTGNLTYLNVLNGGQVRAWDAANVHSVWLRHDGTNGILQTDFSALYLYSPTSTVGHLGDSAGLYEFQIEDSGNARVAAIDSDGNIDAIGNVTANKFTLSFLEADDIRIVPGSFDRPGVSDPAYIAYVPNGGAITTYLLEWKVGDIASFTVQVPHSYAIGTNISVHIHWTAGARGIAESGNTVGWKIDSTWANMDGTFGNMSTANLSDVCDGTNHKHQMTPDIIINGSGKDISSMLICNIKRTDTGTDDTWVTNTAGNLPLLLEADFHYQIDTMGSQTTTVK
jgi:hypothetical protein